MDDEKVMLEAVLRCLKGSSVSNVKSNIINLMKNKKMYMLSWACHNGLEKCGDKMDVLRVMLDYGASLETRVTLRDVDNAERWPGSCTTC